MRSLREKLQDAVSAITEALQMEQTQGSSKEIKQILEQLQDSHPDGLDLNSLKVSYDNDGNILTASAKTLKGGVAFSEDFREQPDAQLAPGLLA